MHRGEYTEDAEQETIPGPTRLRRIRVLVERKIIAQGMYTQEG